MGCDAHSTTTAVTGRHWKKRAGTLQPQRTSVGNHLVNSNRRQRGGSQLAHDLSELVGRDKAFVLGVERSKGNDHRIWPLDGGHLSSNDSQKSCRQP